MQALGLIEVIGFIAAVEGADAALKAANIKLSGIDKAGGGIMTVKLMGDVSAITSAVAAGGEAAKKVGILRTTHVIAGADENVITGFVEKIEKKEEKDDGLFAKSNAELREIVEKNSIPFAGKPIKYAKKEELVAAIEEHRTNI